MPSDPVPPPTNPGPARTEEEDQGILTYEQRKLLGAAAALMFLLWITWPAQVIHFWTWFTSTDARTFGVMFGGFNAAAQAAAMFLVAMSLMHGVRVARRGQQTMAMQREALENQLTALANQHREVEELRADLAERREMERIRDRYQEGPFVLPKGTLLVQGSGHNLFLEIPLSNESKFAAWAIDVSMRARSTTAAFDVMHNKVPFLAESAVSTPPLRVFLQDHRSDEDGVHEDNLKSLEFDIRYQNLYQGQFRIRALYVPSPYDPHEFLLKDVSFRGDDEQGQIAIFMGHALGVTREVEPAPAHVELGESDLPTEALPLEDLPVAEAPARKKPSDSWIKWVPLPGNDDA